MAKDDRVMIATFARMDEAGLLVATLKNAGIEAIMRGQYRPRLFFLAGIYKTLCEVWVAPDDEQRARQIMAENETNADAPPRNCVHCGEENPGNFDICWKCGKSVAE